MKINHRHITLLTFALVTIVVAVFGYLFIYNQTIKQADHYVVANHELIAEDARKQNEQDLIKIYNSTKETRNTLTTLLIHEDKVVDFIEMVEKVGVDSNTDTELTSIVNVGSTIKAKINSKGSWSNVMKSLVLIENLPINISLSNVRLNASVAPEKVSEKNPKQQAVSYWELLLDVEAITIK